MKIGIVGGGQLARMMALAGYPLGLRCTVLDPNADACAGHVAPLVIAKYDDVDALGRLMDEVDVLTFDFENVSVPALRTISERAAIYPPLDALECAQDRLSEKTLFTRLGIPTPAFAPVSSRDELQAAVEAIGLPCVLKTRRMGYDGKGQMMIRSVAGVDAAWNALGDKGELLLEGFVRFKREVSVVSARDRKGNVRHYPLSENKHRDGILTNCFAPAAADDVKAQAYHHVEKILEHFQYVGVLAVEYFDVDGTLVVNEMAPRVHNSGHWTIDGAETSQFENHLRAILGWPLGSTEAIGYSAMLNWIGAMPDPSLALNSDRAHWHDYGKKPRPGRKVGHTTIHTESAAELHAEMAKFATALGNQLASGADAFLIKR